MCLIGSYFSFLIIFKDGVQMSPSLKTFLNGFFISSWVRFPFWWLWDVATQLSWTIFPRIYLFSFLMFLVRMSHQKILRDVNDRKEPHCAACTHCCPYAGSPPCIISWTCTCSVFPSSSLSISDFWVSVCAYASHQGSQEDEITTDLCFSPSKNTNIHCRWGLACPSSHSH